MLSPALGGWGDRQESPEGMPMEEVCAGGLKISRIIYKYTLLHDHFPMPAID